ncbi:S8 family serine peptidase [Brevibacillus sp. SYP-B805]|nr:S8 family serine peptidase [Brevibacillus sp. SYP-B805]
MPAAAKKTPGHVSKRLETEAPTGLSLRTTKSLLAKLSQDDHSSKLVIITFDGPIEEAWKEKVEDLGVELGDYLPDFSFLARVPNDKARAALNKLPFVKRVQSYLPSYKLSPALAKALDSRKDVQVAVIGFNRKNDLRPTLKRLGGSDFSHIESVKGIRHISSLSVQGNRLDKLLTSDDVVAVLPIPERKLYNDVAAGIIHADTLQGTGYTGKGQIVGVIDTGLDTGDVNAIHPDLQGQVKALYAVARKNDASDPIGHGTHVAGSILGTGKASDGRYKGMAPDAKLVFHSVGGNTEEDGLLFDDVYSLLEEAYEDGARIHSDSWGGGDEGEYSIDSFLFDAFLWEHPDMVALVAAGNSGEDGYGTVGSPATAKNVITVGASENDRPEMDDPDSDDPDEVAYFSSRGPTLDGRIKPDVVAPGTFILSTRSSLASDEHFWLPFNQYYAYMGGTSMATPVLAGGIAQIRQYLTEKKITKPSGALLKGMILTGADVLPDGYLEDQGFGRANLEAALETTFVDETKGLKTKGKATYTVNVTDTSRPFVATLTWTDYPASPIPLKKLVNDLNLTVKTPDGKTYNGNDFEQPYNNEVDNLNNVEQVWIPHPKKGTYTVTIAGYNVPEGPQPYALVTNGKLIDPSIKTETKKGTVGTASGRKTYADYPISVKKAGSIALSLSWDDDDDADLELLLLDSKGKVVASTSTGSSPETLSFAASKAGSYKVRVQAKSGDAISYTLSMSYPGK